MNLTHIFFEKLNASFDRIVIWSFTHNCIAQFWWNPMSKKSC